MLDPFTFWSRAMASWQMAGDTGTKLDRTATASHDVIAARTAIMQSAISSPMTADYAELARMVPEKVAAFSSVGNVMAEAWWKAQADCLALASRTASAGMTGRLPSPIDVVQFWTDASLDGLRAMESGSRLGRDALAPIHKTATANARRLKKRRRAT